MSASANAEADLIVSGIPDLGGVRLGDEAGISVGEYERILRAANGGGGSGTPVSAFNSSI